MVALQEVLVKSLSNQKRFLQTGYLMVAAAYIICIVSMLVSINAAVILVNVTTLFYIFVMRTADRMYNRNFARANLRLVCERQLNQVEVFRKGTLNSGHLIECGLFPVRQSGGLACSIAASGKTKQGQADICEITVCYDFPNPVKKHKVGILNGVWMELDLPKQERSRFVLVQKGIMDESICMEFYESQGLHKLQVHSSEKEKFFLFGDSPDDEAAREFLADCRALIQRSGEDGHGLLLQVNGDRVCCFLCDRKLTFSTPIRGRITEDIVSFNRLPELSVLLKFLDM